MFVWDFYLEGYYWDGSDFEHDAAMWVYEGFRSDSKLLRCDLSALNPSFAGGFGVITSTVGYMERTYVGFTSHDIIYYSLTVALVGSWQPTHSFTIQIENNAPTTYYPSAYASNFLTMHCGGTTSYMGFVVGKKFHSTSALTIRISFSISPSISFAVKDLVMSFATHKASDVNGESYTFAAQTSDSVSTGCPYNTYKDSSGNCQACNTVCFLCFGPSVTDCYAPKLHGYFDGTSFLIAGWPCIFGDPINVGKCLICYHGYTLDIDGICKSSCTGTYTKIVDGNAAVCMIPCLSGTYRQLDNTCSSSCDPPFVRVTNHQETACTTPCGQSVNEFLNYDGTCVKSCKYYIKNINNNQICQSCADPALYAYENTTCLSTCQLGFTPSNINGNKFCNYNCAAGKYIYSNGSCLSPCYPLFNIRIEQGSYYFCDSPCNTGQFLYENKSCMSTCQTNFAQRIEDTFQFCTYPCLAGQYLYPNGSCLSPCYSNFKQRAESTYKFCDYPCTSNEYLYLNGSCFSTCTPLFNVRVEGNYQFCDYPCAISQYLYQNKTCKNYCALGFNKRTEGKFKLCDVISGTYLGYVIC